MKIIRNLLSVVLILITTLLVSCSSPTAVKIPTVYTPEKIAQLQVFTEPLEIARTKMATLEQLISSEDWVNTGSFIHGPLGELRQDIRTLAGKLLPKDQPTAEAIAKEIFQHIERIDAAAKERNLNMAKSQYAEAIADFDAFLNLIPKAS